MDREAAARAIEAFLRALGHDPERDAGARGHRRARRARVGRRAPRGLRRRRRRAPRPQRLPGHLGARRRPRHPRVHDLPAPPDRSRPARRPSPSRPNEHLVGVGTVAALVDAFARRLAMQEHHRRARRRRAPEAPRAALGRLPPRPDPRVHDGARRAGPRRARRDARAQRRARPTSRSSTPRSGWGK